MSGALPTTRQPSQVTVESWSPTFLSRAQSLKTQRRRRGTGVHRWKLHFEYQNLALAEFQDLHAFLNAQRGQWDTWTAVLPSGISPRGSWGGTPLVNGAQAAGLTSIAIDGLPISTSGAGKQGDYIKFAGHSKVYQLAADAGSNGSGQATLSIMPGLNATLADNEAIVFSSVPFTLILTSDLSTLGLVPGYFGTLSFDAIEDF